MSLGKYFILFLLFFISIILQISLFSLVAPFNAQLNVIFILFFIVIFFENPKEYQKGLFSASIAGLFLDMYTTSFGISLFSLLITYGIFKLAIYFLKDSQTMAEVLYFSLLFFIFFIIYQIVFTLIAPVQFSIHANNIVSLAYNTIVAVGFFYIARKYFFVDNNRQLTLFR